MFRQAIVYVALFLFGMISSHALLMPTIEKPEDFNIAVNDNLTIVSVINTNNEILHHKIDYESLKFIEDVEGIIHYTIGARNSREYGIFWNKVYLFKCEKEGMGKFTFNSFFSIDFVTIVIKEL